MLRAARTFRALLALLVCLGTVAPLSAAADESAGPAAALASAYAAVLRSINPHLALTQSVVYAQALLASANKWRLDPALVMALVTVESSWNFRAVSYSGAIGLGQLKPETAHNLGVDPRSVHDNLRGTTLYLHRLLRVFHDARQPMRAALAGYNAGPLTVKMYGATPNAETTHYVAKVLREYKTLRKRVAARNVDVADATDGRVADAHATDGDPVGDERYWGQ